MTMVGDIVVVEDAVSTKARKRDPLYVDRVRVYPKRVHGTFRRVKWAALIVLLAIYYIAPWLRWDRGPGAPDQAFLIDMPNRRAYFLWLEIWPQEVYFLMGLLIIAAFGLFFVTSLAGRVWCGYACPQTVWTDLYMWVERLIEGDRNARIKLDAAPLSAGKLAIKSTKHGAWLAIAALTGGAWIMYFNDAPTVIGALVTGAVSLKVTFFFGLFTATTYLLAGWSREQVCTYMCPWPRFQSAMFDEDTYVVTYQAWRGEPRGKRKKGESWEGRGHCVDCNQCVAVCPTGIDIRDGSQLECIGCGLCIDACDGVMSKVGLPSHLITLDTQSHQAARTAGRPLRYRVVRPRTILYAALLLLASGLMAAGLAARTTSEVTVQHERNPLFVTLSDGAIRNDYTIKILNKERLARHFVVSVEGLAGARVWIEGQEGLALAAAADAVTTARVHVAVPGAAAPAGSSEIVVAITDIASNATARHGSVFVGPER
ncbi:MAG: cytochrome c oxidase accessory protein CcoG [Alphaproteobacteria bacterium]